ncbi:DNA replication complex GINS protein PSF1-like [Onthophagus taurus]|uniref:DNA replication complex GINS protein PSF1-like n=1 Tax=Onthophagus taurus TaxID=166361 RepID=UPI000C20010E|nr:DNA replication complex GINS protein PSF1-like [Onthophagus taurus]
MFGEKAVGLIKELDRNQDLLPPYNADLVLEVKKEIHDLAVQNQNDAAESNETMRTPGSISYLPTVRIRHIAIKRNLRCLMAYNYNRLTTIRKMRWEFGSVLPVEIKGNLSPTESAWFTRYSNILAKYMRSLSEDGIVNLGVDLKPPKSLYIQVRCLTDYGKFELNDGRVLLLKKNSRHYLPRNECEELIRQGVFQHIMN